jgi:hypothetical protein
MHTAPYAYEIVFPGTNHMSFTDLALASPPLTAILNNSENYSVNIFLMDTIPIFSEFYLHQF